MSELNMYRSTPRKVKEFVNDCIYAGLVPYVHSSPGMGKSSIMAQIAQAEGLQLIDHRLSTSAPEDLSGLPRFNSKGEAEFAPFADLFPIQGRQVPTDKNGWMLFLDEFPAASKSVQAAAFKLVLDKLVGQKKLHENVVITAAGNLMTDRSIVNPISTAMQSRVIHIEMEISFDEWLMDVALKQGYDSRIIAFLSQNNSKLMDFKPTHNEKTFCCPRTWEFMNKLIQGKEVSDGKTALYAGTITSAVAVEFVEFTKCFANMVNVKQILADPEGCPVPHDQSTKWAVITHMMEKITDKVFGDLAKYANRFDLPFRVLFFRMALVNHPKLRQHPAFAQALGQLAKYLAG